MGAEDRRDHGAVQSCDWTGKDYMKGRKEMERYGWTGDLVNLPEERKEKDKEILHGIAQMIEAIDTGKYRIDFKTIEICIYERDKEIITPFDIRTDLETGEIFTVDATIGIKFMAETEE